MVLLLSPNIEILTDEAGSSTIASTIATIVLTMATEDFTNYCSLDSMSTVVSNIGSLQKLYNVYLDHGVVHWDLLSFALLSLAMQFLSRSVVGCGGLCTGTTGMF